MKTLLTFLAGLVLGALVLSAFQSRWDNRLAPMPQLHRVFIIQFDRWTGRYTCVLETGM